MIALQIPVGEEKAFRGTVDLVRMEAHIHESGKRVDGPIPDDLAERAKAEHERLVETVAEGEDDLMEKFFAQGTLEAQDILPGLKQRDRRAQDLPGLLRLVSSLGIGVLRILDACVALLPSPEGRKNDATGKDGKPDGRVRQREGSRRRAGLQDRLRPVRRTHLLPARPLRALPVRRDVLERHQGNAGALLGALPPPGQGARQRPRGARRRHRRRGEAQGHAAPGDTLTTKDFPVVIPAAVGAGGLDRLRHRGQGEGGRGQDRHRAPQADRGGSLARVPARRGDQGVPPGRRLAAPRRDRRGAAQEALRRRGHPPSAEGPLPRDDHAQGRGARPAQEADRRPRPVRGLPHPGRAAAPRQGLRVRRRHLRRRDPAQLHPRRREGHPGGRAARATSPGTRWSISA